MENSHLRARDPSSNTCPLKPKAVKPRIDCRVRTCSIALQGRRDRIASNRQTRERESARPHPSYSATKEHIHVASTKSRDTTRRRAVKTKSYALCNSHYRRCIDNVSYSLFLRLGWCGRCRRAQRTPYVSAHIDHHVSILYPPYVPSLDGRRRQKARRLPP